MKNSKLSPSFLKSTVDQTGVVNAQKLFDGAVDQYVAISQNGSHERRSKSALMRQVRVHLESHAWTRPQIDNFHRSIHTVSALELNAE